jgi:predicted MFS family arabinose efflux permease
MRRRSLRPRSELWHRPDFLRLWGAQTVSQVGSQVSALAIPLTAVLVLHASAFEVSVLSAVEMLPFLLVALPAGVWVDRLPRRPILIAGDLGRALALASIPVAAAAGSLRIEQLYVVGFATGLLTVFFDVAYQSYLPALVDRRQLVEANSKLEISRSGAQIAGPGLAGLLVGWLTAPYAIVVDAVSFLWSGLLALRIRTTETVEAGGDRNLRRELWEGLRYLVGDPLFRNMAAFVAVFNFGTGMTGPLILVYAVRGLGLTPAQLGLAFMLGNVGWLAGAAVARRVSTALGLGRTFAIAGVLGGVPFFLYPLAPRSLAIEFIVVAQVVVSFGIVLFNVPGISLYQTRVPARLLGRMNASRRWIVWGVIPLGSLVGGVLAATVGLRETLFVGAAICTVAGAWLLSKPIRALGTVDDDARAPGDGGVAAPAR